MKTVYESAVADAPVTSGQVLKGQYAGAYRSDKGKIKGLLLQTSEAEYTIKLPKYLRPMLVRELAPGDFIQVWAYPEDERWRAINILPLPEGEVETLRPNVVTPAATLAQPQQKRQCIEVCTKGKCCKQGSQQLYSALKEAVDDNPDLAHVSVKATGCMKACKHGPNLRLPSGRMVSRPNPAQVLAALEQKA